MSHVIGHSDQMFGGMLANAVRDPRRARIAQAIAAIDSSGGGGGGPMGGMTSDPMVGALMQHAMQQDAAGQEYARQQETQSAKFDQRNRELGQSQGFETSEREAKFAAEQPLRDLQEAELKRRAEVPLEDRSPEDVARDDAALLRQRMIDEANLARFNNIEGKGLPREAVDAVLQKALERSQGDVRDGVITPEQAQEEMERAGRDPAYARERAVGRMGPSPQDQMQSVIKGALLHHEKDWSDTDAEDLWAAGEENAAGQRQMVIHKLLKAGFSPEEIGELARSTIENQSIIDPSTLDTDWYKSDAMQETDPTTGKPRPQAAKDYGDMWKKLAYQLMAGPSAPPEAE